MGTTTDGGQELSIEELARQITSAAVRLAAATGAWLALIGEFDRREGWGGHGIRSCAHWLAWQCGLTAGTAREHVRVARALHRLPAVAAALTGGRISYAKARAITRVAEPDTEDQLLETALVSTAAQLERIVREWRRADRPPPDAASRQTFDAWWDDDGMLHVDAVLDAQTGAEFLTGVESLVERGARRDRAATDRGTGEGDAEAEPSPGVGNDARRRIEQRLTPSGYHDLDVGENGNLLAAKERTTARRCAAMGQLGAAAGAAHLAGGPALHPTTVARMLCGATVITMLEHGREPLAHGRTRRAPSRAQRRALQRRDRGCANPACAESRPERLHAHHLRHWLFGGPTDLDNLVLLCESCHAQVHDAHLVLHRRNGQLIAITPDGRRVWGPADAAYTGNHWAGVHPIDTVRGRPPGADVPAETPPPLHAPADDPNLPDQFPSTGERMHLATVVGTLLAARDRLRHAGGDGGHERAAA